MLKLFLLFTLFSIATLNSQVWKEMSDKANESIQKRDFDAAINFTHEAIKDVTRIYGDSSKFHINQYGTLGKIYFYKGLYDKSIEYYEMEKFLILKFRSKEDLYYARAVNNLSVVYASIGKNDKVEELLKESIDIKLRVMGNMDTSYAKSINNLGMYYYNKGNYPEAEKLLSESLIIKKQKLSKNDPSTGLTLMNLGMLYEGLGNRDLALKYLEESYAIMKVSLPEGHPDRVSTQFQLASLYVLSGDSKKAEELTKNTSLDDKGPMTVDKANTVYNYSQLQIRLGRDDLASKVLESALPKVKGALGMGHPLYSKMLKALGITKWINNELEAAYQLFIENLEITRQLYGEKNIQYASALHNVAGLLKALEYYEEADKKYFEAFEVYFFQLENYFPYFSESEKTKFYRMIKERFDMFNSYVVSRNVDNPMILGKMYDYHIKTKGILLDYSKNLSTNIENSGDEELLIEYKKLVAFKEQLSELYSKNQIEIERLGIDIEEFENKTNALEKDISIKLSKYSNDLNKDYTWKDIQSKLKADEAAIEIIRFNFYTKAKIDSMFYAILILTSETKDRPRLILLENADELDGKFLMRYKKTVKAKFPDKNSYNAYWKEIDEKLGDKKRIYFSSDGVYNLINISSLRMPDGNFVLDNKTIINLNNTKEILIDNKFSNTNGKSIFMGNPNYELENAEETYKMASKIDKKNQILISPLPGTGIEVNKIEEIFNERNQKALKLTENEASEANFKTTKSPYILHIATHGYFLSDLSEVEGESVFGVDVEKAVQNPLLRSGLLFSGASNFLNYDGSKETKDNGILTAFEVKNMDLRGTELVVMSACETGLGEVMNGEGVYGLQRAFQVAGAKSIIMSLWTVDDKTTQELMVEFYQRYLNGMDKIQAFREARLVIRDRYKEPYFWGAFKLLGKE